MPYFRVDDQFAMHPKAIAAGNMALGLWVRAGSWCAAHLTDGALPTHMLRTLGAQKRDADKLVKAGLWMQTPVGYEFLDWTDYQPTKAQVKAERAASKERQQRWREGRSNGVSNGVTDGVTNGVSNGVSNAAHSVPFPSSVVQDHLSMPDRTGASNGDRPRIGKQPNPVMVASVLGTDEQWAGKVIAQVLARAPASVMDPAAYVMAAIRERPEDYRPTRTPPRPDQLCEHGKQQPCNWCRNQEQQP